MLQGSWMRKQWRQRLLTLTVVCAMLSAGSAALGAGDPNDTGAPRSRVYKFRNIKSQRAQDVLTQLKIGTEYNALTEDVLIVTGRSGTELIKASEVLELLDRKEAIEVRTLMAGTDTDPLPVLEVFILRLKTITAGTLLDGPPSAAPKPAIVDILDKKLIAIATAEVLNEIETALNEWQNEQAKASVKPAAEPQEESVAVPEPQPAPTLPAVETNVPAVIEPAPAEPETPAEQPQVPAEQPQAVEAAEEMIPTQSVPAAIEAVEPKEAVAETTEDFLEDELLKTLADAEQKARQQAAQAAAVPTMPAVAEPQPAVQAVPADVNEPKPAVQDTPAQTPAVAEKEAIASEEDAMKMIAALMKQAQADQAVPQEPAETITETAAAEALPAKEAVTEAAATENVPAPLKAEIEGLREQLARLEQMLGERGAAPAGGTEELPRKTTAAPVKMDSQLSEKELEVVLDLPQEIDLENLVDLVGKQLGLNYMYDKTILQGQKVQLKVNGGKIKVGETYALLESVLRFKGFVMTRREGLVTILKAADLPRAETSLRMPDEPISAGDIVVSTVFHLSYVDVNTAQNMLKGMNLGTTFTAINETNTLIVTDYAYRMSQIQQVLGMIDVKGETKEYKFRTLNYLKPSELVTKLKDLAGQLQGVNLQISTPAATQPATRAITTRDPQTGRTVTQQVPVSTATPSAGPAASGPGGGGTAQSNSVYIDTDDRTNRILIAGKHDQILLVNELIDALDVPQFNLRYVREYIIQYVEAIEVVNVLNGLGLANVTVSSTSTAQTQTSRTSTSRTPQAQVPGQPVQPQQPQVVQPAAAAGSSAGPEQPYISIRPATNSLLVNATAEQHKSIELVIAHVDVIQKDQRTIRQYEIQHVDTQEIMDTLTNLGIVAPQQQTTTDTSRSTSGRSTASSRTMQPAQMQQTPEGGMMTMSLPTAEGGSEVDVTAEQPQIAVLRATNSLLVYATPRQHDAISLVIAHADRVPEVASTPYVVYALENQDPLELADVLTKLIQETVQEQSQQSAPDSKIQTAATTRTSVIPTLEEEKIRIIPDEMSYSLIVYANKRNQQWISELIKELDEYRPQVLLDCTLVEVTKDDEFQYSIDMVAKTYDGSSLQPATPVRPIGTPFSTDNTLADASTVGGNITAFLNTGSVQALLTAMQTKGFGRVMSQPKLLVNDNQDGEIKSETKTSIAQKKTIVSPATGTSPESRSEDVSFAEYSAGVTLKIRPHISKGDMLRLEIVLTRADFKLQPDVTIGTSGTFPRPPDILSTDVTSVATVPDGTTIVLGGLESVTQNKTQTKVPILGDIPLLGTLFRSVDDTDKQSKLYVFVKAHVIRPGDQIGGLKDIRRVSKKYREEFEDMESKFQKQSAIPGLKSKPLEPATVLEEDDDYLDKLEERLQEMELKKSSVQ
jgi:type II secretory pathway component GspD/PulD (secretin)